MSDEENEMVEMRVEGLVFDPLTNTPIIILKDMEGERSLPIWVGYPEATAIALEMENVTTPRPMTHDLIKNLVDGLGVSVKHILVNSLKSNTFYAIISVNSLNGHSVDIDSRPSDAIAVALRLKAPIFVLQKVLDSAKAIDMTIPNQGVVDEETFKKWIDDVKPSDFGNLDQ